MGHVSVGVSCLWILLLVTSYLVVSLGGVVI